MIRVPVLLNFDYDKVIGIMELDETQLPKNPNWVFSLGYLATDAEVIGEKVNVTAYKLFTVSLQSDESYMEYLKATL